MTAGFKFNDNMVTPRILGKVLLSMADSVDQGCLLLGITLEKQTEQANLHILKL